VITEIFWTLFVGFNTAVIFYFFALNGIYLVTSLVAIRELRRYARRVRSIEVDEMITAAGAPEVTIIAPAFNEEVTCIASVRALLMLKYPAYEIIIVNDGSRDRTLDRLADEFELVPTPRFPTATIDTARVRGVYQSRTYANLWVVDKENGGRADAINAGINFCDTPLLCIIDADSILERDALMRVVRPFLEDQTTVGAGGIIRIANGCTIDRGFITRIQLPRTLLARMQVVEYLRSFLAGRVGWNALGATFIISGAFGVWRRDTVVAVGGLDRDTVGEDMELTLRVHRYYRERKLPYRITFIPDPVLWTEVPERMRDLGRQRDRWQRGLMELLHRHRRMLFNPRYGRIGMIVVPYLYLLEMIGPLIEFIGYFAIAFAIVAGIANAAWLLAFLVLALAFGVTVSIASVALEELCFRRYPRFLDLVRLFGISVLENFGHRQIITFWRVYGFFTYFRGKKGWGGSLQRVGFSAADASLTPAGTRGGRA
jgi:cellulose synthase/poly-beta-1,6-N-acetylglucosamine synthase-like glycosyltransferase